jgi:hypothetical protein
MRSLAIMFLLFATVSLSAEAQWLEQGSGIQLVRVAVPTATQVRQLQALGLDLTEARGPGYVEVVLYGADDARALREAGLEFTVRIPDLVARNIENRRADLAYARTNASSPLPSGRTSYRHLIDYEADLRRLVADHPGKARLVTLDRRSLEGREVLAIEISDRVDAAGDGKPVFLLDGLIHAREWPAGEVAMEFAFDLLQSQAGGDARVRSLLERTRIIVVPVVNPDGFNLSRTAGDVVDPAGTVAPITLLPGIRANASGYFPGGAYHRKNCRMVPGQDTVPGTCASPTSGEGLGIDLNRNFGYMWGADSNPLGETYSGPGPFSEPESRNIRELISARQVTGHITVHTFGGLVLRPPGIAATGVTEDDTALLTLGHRLAEVNAGVSLPSWELYDTRGTSSEWVNAVTGSFSYVFELPYTEFHPPFEQVVADYLGTGAYAGLGEREAFLLGAESAADASHHAVLRLTGMKPGTFLRLRKQFDSGTQDGSPVPERLESTQTVTHPGIFDWHVNPSTRPEVKPHFLLEVGAETRRTIHADHPGPMGLDIVEIEHVVADPGPEALRFRITWPANISDVIEGGYVMDVSLRDRNGNLKFVKYATYSAPSWEATLVQPQPGTYVLRVGNLASLADRFTVTTTEHELLRTALPGDARTESYALTCETVNGEVLQEVDVAVARGETLALNLSACSGLPAAASPRSEPAPTQAGLMPASLLAFLLLAGLRATATGSAGAGHRRDTRMS